MSDQNGPELWLSWKSNYYCTWGVWPSYCCHLLHTYCYQNCTWGVWPSYCGHLLHTYCYRNCTWGVWPSYCCHLLHTHLLLDHDYIFCIYYKNIKTITATTETNNWNYNCKHRFQVIIVSRIPPAWQCSFVPSTTCI